MQYHCLISSMTDGFPSHRSTYADRCVLRMTQSIPGSLAQSSFSQCSEAAGPEHCPLCADEFAVLVHPNSAAQQQPGAGQEHIVSIFSQVIPSCALRACCILQRIASFWSKLLCPRQDCSTMAPRLHVCNEASWESARLDVSWHAWQI